MGKLYVVGIGPGDPSYLTGAAKRALEDSDVLCGYTLYIDLIREEYPEKEVFSTPMKGEIERCGWALETARKGRTVALICSGDAGVYGMAAPVLELAHQYPDVRVEIVSGITAALSGAALLGAPLNHDFCVISLSDLLTPWEVIEKRLRSAAEGDFAVCLYNPASHQRKDHLKKACGILLRYRGPETVCGIVRSIGREGESCRILSLKELESADADMFSTVFIGSSRTFSEDGKMITPRGYRI